MSRVHPREVLRPTAACVAAAALVTACGPASAASAPQRSTATIHPSPTATPTPSPTPAGYFTMTVNDSVANAASVPCPRGTPFVAECFTLIESGSSPQLGTMTVTHVLDIEYPANQPQCGAQHAFVERLAFAAGILTVRVVGPYLCLGATGATQRTFTVLSGSGRFAGAAGSGTVEFGTLSVGASEAWEGSVLIAGA